MMTPRNRLDAWADGLGALFAGLALAFALAVIFAPWLTGLIP